MLNDDNLSLYAYALILAGVMLGASFVASDPRIEVAAIERDEVALGAIETASIPADSSPAAAWNAPEVPWTDYERGMRRVAETGKPAVLVLHADWCRVCQSYQKLFHDPAITRFSDDYVFILADVDDQPELQRRYDVDGDYVPRTLILDSPGALAVEASGGHPRQRFFVDPYDRAELENLLDANRPDGR